MQPQRSDTDESLLTVKDGSGINERKSSTPVQVHREWSNPILTELSPRPAPKSPQSPGPKSSFRVRSDSGLAWNTNQAPFRRSAHRTPESWLSAWSSSATALSDEDENSSEEDHLLDHSSSKDVKGLVSNGQLLPDFFEPAVIDLVLSNPDTVRRLRAFAQVRHTGSDIDFLSKVEQYSHALEDIIGFMSDISQHFTGSMATSPLELTPGVAGALKSNVKYCTRAALPALDKLYQEATATAQERLSRKLYPEFVKYQLSQCLTASLSTHFMFGDQLRHRYPGLGEAFCLTDPLRPDNPIVSASDGFLSMSGYPRRELMGKNCRLLQGPGTDPEAVCRLSQAAAANKPVTELLLNYKPDGRPYWNLLFICPLVEKGNVRYSLGAQINVSENMGSDYEDILGILNFGRSPGQLSPQMDPPGSPQWPARRSSEHVDTDDLDDQHGGEQRTSRRRRFLRHFQRRSPSSRASSHSRSTASVEENSPPPPTVPSPPAAYPPPFASERLEHHYTLPYPYNLQEKQLHIDEQSTPYSRFFVLRFTNPHPPSVSANYLTSPHRASVSPHRRARERGTSGSGSDRSGGGGSSSGVGDPVHKQRLPIAFCSPHALSLLGIKLQSHHESNPSAAVAGRDIFAVLASHFDSPTVNRAFRETVLGHLVRGESYTADLMAPGYWGGSGTGSGGGGGGGGHGGRSRERERGREKGLGGGFVAGSGSTVGLGLHSRRSRTNSPPPVPPLPTSASLSNKRSAGSSSAGLVSSANQSSSGDISGGVWGATMGRNPNYDPTSEGYASSHSRHSSQHSHHSQPSQHHSTHHHKPTDWHDRSSRFDRPNKTERSQSQSRSRRRRPSGTATAMMDRGTGFLSQVLMLGGAGAGMVSSGPSGKRALRRVVSSWVPLKDGVGRVVWVVLVLTPVSDAL